MLDGLVGRYAIVDEWDEKDDLLDGIIVEIVGYNGDHILCCHYHTGYLKYFSIKNISVMKKDFDPEKDRI